MILAIVIFNHLDNASTSKKNEHDEHDSTIKQKPKNQISLFNYFSVAVAIFSIVYQSFVFYQALKETFLNNKDTFWLIIKLLTGLTIAYCTINFLNYKTNFLVSLKRKRRAAIIIICLIPFICGSWATKNAYNIIHGNDTLLIDADTKCNSAMGTQYRYISSLSDKAFALSLKDGSICVFKYNYLKLTPENKTYNQISNFEINRK